MVLLHVIGKTYGIGILRLVRTSPRLGILLAAVFLAICFTIIDLVATVTKTRLSTVNGIEPYWKLSLVCKCLTDAIMLDDFRTELRRIGANKMGHDEFDSNNPDVARNDTAQASVPKPVQMQPPVRVKRRSTEIESYLEIEHSIRKP